MSMSNGDPPLVRARVILPAILMVQEAGEDVYKLAAKHGISSDALWEPDALLPVPQCNEMLSGAAKLLGDPFLGASVGLAWANSNEAPFRSAKQKAQNLGHLLSLIAVEFGSEATTGQCELRVSASKATFMGTRQYKPGPLASFGAAAFVSFILNLIKNSAKAGWDTAKISVVAPVKNLLPPAMLPKSSLAVGGDQEFRFTFPVEWLSETCQFEGSLDLNDPTDNLSINPDLIVLVKTYLEGQIPDGDTSVSSAAKAFSLSAREFQKKLKANGTSFRELLLAQKMAFAKERLHDDDTSIKDLAARLGYTNVSNFSRAFQTYTGETPSSFKKARASPT